MLKGRVHSFESFGAVDGPGVRFLIFLQGCPMRCRYCHNPDSWKIGAGEEYSAEEILDRAERFRSYWGDRGGITVSGGEALLQIDFLIELFELARERGISTCLDTSAQPFCREGVFLDKFRRLMKVTDTVLLDIKHIDEDEHRSLTGHTNRNILDCARYLDEIGKRVWIRHVLVPGITDNDEWLVQLRDFLSTLSNVERIDVLPYHTMGIYKYRELGIKYSLEGVEPPSRERIDNANRILQPALSQPQS